ncbi:secreted RxLR effector protein 78-like [Juglans microcarpa x Juglans regia]|uniref:secreted RxLR effector protein 78-like n=1 Tax=Juglans microcarpa x Juglans regia TaxID=2249226 RepID=UPI001B7E9465|nr:secreted RxLR effector protein 78-like [Juglans microcarpa x Juglans regia]
MAKVLANGLKIILPYIISDSQSAFVPKRQIIDNVLLAHVVVQFLKKKRAGKTGFMSIKLDMSKAYDRLEWDFLVQIMYKLGFNTKWINLVMRCVKTVSYSILINGDPKGPIFPMRGLRQGDHLSPYLFLLSTESLISLLHSAKQSHLITGVKICRGAPRLNHLLFADDSLGFCKATQQENENVHNLLEKYEHA